MGLVFFIGINWLLAGMLVAVIKSPSKLLAVAKGWIEHPIVYTFMFVWMTSIIVAGWGVISGGKLSWPIQTPWGAMQSWKFCGLMSFAGLGVLFLASVVENHRHRKRYETPPPHKE